MKALNNNNTIKTMEVSQKDLTTSGLVLQAYCNTVLQQPDIDFSSAPDLSELQEEIKESLENAKRHANFYLNDINQRIIRSLSDLNSYFTVYKMVPTTLPEGTSEEQWIAVLSILKSISENNLRNSETIVESLEELRNNLRTDSQAFTSIAKQANDAVEGDNGELESISDSIKEIDHAINVQIQIIVGSGIAIAGGAFTIAMGSITSFVTSGLSAELVVGGVIAVGAGTAGMTVAITELTFLHQQKSALFQKTSKLKAEINLLTGVDSAFNDLSNQADSAAVITRDLAASWKDLTSNLESLINDLSNGIVSTDDVRNIFLNEANNEIVELQNTINTIRQQMAGIVTITIPEGETVSSYLEVV